MSNSATHQSEEPTPTVATLSQLMKLSPFDTIGSEEKTQFMRALTSFIQPKPSESPALAPRRAIFVGDDLHQTSVNHRELIDASELCRTFFDAHVWGEGHEAFDLRLLAQHNFQSLSIHEEEKLRDYLLVVSDAIIGLKEWDENKRATAQRKFIDVVKQFGWLVVHPKDSVPFLQKTDLSDRLNDATRHLLVEGSFFRNEPYQSTHPIVVATMRKSGTIYMAETLERILGTTFFSPRILPELEGLFFDTISQRRHIVFDHYTPNPRFLDFIKNCGVRRLLVQIRHPIEAAFSDYFYRRGHRFVRDPNGNTYSPLPTESIQGFSEETFFKLIASNVSFIETWRDFVCSPSINVDVQIGQFRSLSESPLTFINDMLEYFGCSNVIHPMALPQAGKSNYTGYDPQRWKSKLPNQIVVQALERVPKDILAMFD